MWQYRYIVIVVKWASLFIWLILKYKYQPWNLYWRGRLSKVDLLVLTSSDQHIFICVTLFTFFTIQVTLMRRSTVLSHSLQLVFPVSTYHGPMRNFIIIWMCINQNLLWSFYDLIFAKTIILWLKRGSSILGVVLTTLHFLCNLREVSVS